MARVECKYNWTPVAHFLLESIAAHDFKAGELRLLMLILRETYGRTYFVGKEEHRRETCRLKQSEISKRTGIPEPSIRRIIASLVKARVLRRPLPSSKGKPAALGLNTKVAQWSLTYEGEIRESKMPSIDGCIDDIGDTGKVSPEEGNKDHHGSPIPGIGDHHGSEKRSAVIPIAIRCDPYFESQPNNHAVFEPSKEPLLNNLGKQRDLFPEDWDEEEADEKSDGEMMVSDIIRNIHKVWYKMTGIPYTIRTAAKLYVDSNAGELDEAWQVFDEVYTAAVIKHNGGTRVYPPGILNDAAGKMDALKAARNPLKKSS